MVMETPEIYDVGDDEEDEEIDSSGGYENG